MTSEKKKTLVRFVEHLTGAAMMLANDMGLSYHDAAVAAKAFALFMERIDTTEGMTDEQLNAMAWALIESELEPKGAQA